MGNTLAQEKALYENVYKSIPEYNRHSPCASLLPIIIDIANQHGVKSILDAGCGKGQSVHALDIGGFNARGIDLTLDGLLPEVNEALCIEAPLSDMPLANNEFDMTICVDVLEHIPQDDNMLNDSLKEIARVSARFAFLQICTRKDCFGKRVNATLHKSVFPSAWWVRKLREHFAYVEILEQRGGDVMLFCIHRA
jgi:SAM-dependent methyltransferase